ncbi:hypothetical protein Hanom_Chr15g01363201 [Helianthus anomalus]
MGYMGHFQYLQKQKLYTFLDQSHSLNNSANSSSVDLSKTGKETSAPHSKACKCLGFILFSKLNAKNCGKLFNSFKSLFISLSKYSNLGLKFLSTLKVNSPGHLKTISTASGFENPKLIK